MKADCVSTQRQIRHTTYSSYWTYDEDREQNMYICIWVVHWHEQYDPFTQFIGYEEWI